MTISKTRREEIRRFYRGRRVEVDKTQVEVAEAARMDQWRFFRIENGRAFPKDDERPKLARVLKVAVEQLPTPEAQAVSA